MSEPFCSVYTKSYRSFDREPELEATRSCAYFKDLGENFLPLEDSKTIYNPERDESVIKDLHLKRLISTYQQSYCLSDSDGELDKSMLICLGSVTYLINEGKRSMVIDPDNLEEDQFMVHFNKYYAPRKGPVPRPLDTARRIYGYSRFSYWYTERSVLEDTIYREGFEYFKKDFDKGKSRLFAKKQREMHEARRRAKGEETGKAEEKTEETREEEAKPEVGSEQPQKRLSREKICQICCEKFGDFCYPVQNCQKLEVNRGCEL